MKKPICLFALVILISGCALSQERINANIETHRRKEYGFEIVLDKSYKDSFNLVLDVFRHNDIYILKRDYEGKTIFGTGDKHPGLLMDTFTVFLEEQGQNKTKLIVKGAKSHALLKLIEDEIEFQKKINH